MSSESKQKPKDLTDEIACPEHPEGCDGCESWEGEVAREELREEGLTDEQVNDEMARRLNEADRERKEEDEWFQDVHDWLAGGALFPAFGVDDISTATPAALRELRLVLEAYLMEPGPFRPHHPLGETLFDRVTSALDARGVGVTPKPALGGNPR